jgi:DNA-binding winged helix-turn-helix (wHTH) protein
MRVVFGECEFDSGRRVLLRHGSTRALSPKAFELLEFLLDRRPEVVAKTEILERLWPETFVSDASLHNLVAEIRAALGDAPRAARYIRTVPRYGYAFHGDARPVPTVNVSRPTRSGRCLVSKHGEWVLSEGSNLVGRDRDCAVHVDSADLSRRHARIVVTPAETTIEDLGSKNGTEVNGERITHPLTLKDSDQIQVGSLTMTYRVWDTLPSTLTRRRV